MMGVNVQVSSRFDLDIKAAVPRQLVEHMVKETDARLRAALPGSIQV